MTLSVSRHRRSWRVGRIAAVVAGAAVVIAGGAAAALRLGDDGCGGSAVTVTLAAAPEHYPVVDGVADDWNAGRPTVDGRCAQVVVEAMPSSFAATALSPAWDEQRDGTRPDVWLPDSSLWLQVAASRPEAAALLPAHAPSLAASPVVLAMQQPMAEALGWPERQLGWTDLVGAFARGQDWEQFGHPEWGPLRLGLADPTRTTAGMAAVLTIFDPDGDQRMSDQELLAGIAFTQLVTAFEADTEGLLRRYANRDAEAVTAEPAGFPVLERDLAQYATAAGPGLPLVPVYPREGMVVADYPYAVLDAPWVDLAQREIADQFLDHLSGPGGRAAYDEAGFRDPGHAVPDGSALLAATGFSTELGTTRVVAPEALNELIGMWGVLQRPNNLLVVLDTSGSMDDAVPGAGLTRLQLLRRAAIEGIGLLSNQTQVGLWEFATGLTPTTPYRELVTVGPAGEEVGGSTRRETMVRAVQGLAAAGGTGLYDTVHDAYQLMRERWQPDAQNLLVVITDGKDEDHDGRSLARLLADLEELVRAEQPLPVIALAVGPEADAAALERIVGVTGGRVVVARDDVSAIEQVVLAFAGRIS